MWGKSFPKRVIRADKYWAAPPLPSTEPQLGFPWRGWWSFEGDGFGLLCFSMLWSPWLSCIRIFPASSLFVLSLYTRPLDLGTLLAISCYRLALTSHFLCLCITDNLSSDPLSLLSQLQWTRGEVGCTKTKSLKLLNSDASASQPAANNSHVRLGTNLCWAMWYGSVLSGNWEYACVRADNHLTISLSLGAAIVPLPWPPRLLP